MRCSLPHCRVQEWCQDPGVTPSHTLEEWRRGEGFIYILWSSTCSITCPMAWGTGRGSAPPSIDTVGLWGVCLELTASTLGVCTPKMNAAGNVPLRKQASCVLRYWRMLNTQDDTIHSYHIWIPMTCVSPSQCERARSCTELEGQPCKSHHNSRLLFCHLEIENKDKVFHLQML